MLCVRVKELKTPRRDAPVPLMYNVRLVPVRQVCKFLKFLMALSPYLRKIYVARNYYPQPINFDIPYFEECESRKGRSREIRKEDLMPELLSQVAETVFNDRDANIY